MLYFENILHWQHIVNETEDSDIPLVNQLLSQASVAFFLFNTKKKLFWCNPTAQALLGGCEDVQGKTLDSLFSEAGFSMQISVDEALMEASKGNNQHFEVEQNLAGKKCFFQCELTANQQDTDWIQFQLTDRTVDALRIAEEHQKRLKSEKNDRSKSLFLASISHEIRTPLNSIIGFSDLLLDQDDVAEESQEYARMIQAAGDTLLQLINDIIDVSKIEAGQIKISKQLVDVDKTLNEILLMIQGQLKSRNKTQIGISIEKPAFAAPFQIETDPNRFRQIFTNLLTNAIKFIESGSIHFGYTEIHGDCVQFFVKDTGSGIERDKIPHIFQRFAKFDDPYGINHEGSGLGLFITKQLVELMGGKIWFDSEFQKGTTFYFTLPIMKGEQVISSDYHPHEPEASWNGLVILVVDDVEENFRFYQSAFKNSGAEIIWASKGDEAIRVCLENPKISLVLMDIMMPYMDAFDTTRKIKALYPSLPVIAQTAFYDPEGAQKACKAGCDHYITKPIQKSELVAIINQLLKTTG